MEQQPGDMRPLQRRTCCASSRRRPARAGSCLRACARRASGWARALSDAGADAAAYHAGQDAAQRLRTQRAWSQGDTSVVVRPASLLRLSCAACGDAL